MVIALAQLHKWKVAHFRAAMTRGGRWVTPVQGDGAGFPDLLMVRERDRRVLAVELKVGRNKPTPGQREWLARFAAVGVAAAVWRPEMWDEIEGVLR